MTRLIYIGFNCCNVVSGGCLSTVMAAVPRDRSGVTSSENYELEKCPQNSPMPVLVVDKC